MNPLVWVLKWCNPNHIAFKKKKNYSFSWFYWQDVDGRSGPSDWAPSGSLNIFVNTFVYALSSSSRKMRGKVLIWYHHYRQKAMSILKQSASNRRQKYNNRRQSVRSKREFQWSLYGFSSPPPSLTLLCAFAAREEMHTKLFLLLSRDWGCVGHLHVHTHTHTRPRSRQILNICCLLKTITMFGRHSTSYENNDTLKCNDIRHTRGMC